jgi:acyl-coenzyme A synthetase/AMP-(fatty) acid ligase
MNSRIFQSLLNQNLCKYKDKILILNTIDENALTWQEAEKLIYLLSSKMQSTGIKKGNMVINYCPLSLESIILCWACLLNGQVFIPLDHNWPAGFIDQIIKETAPCLILTDDQRKATFENINTQIEILTCGENSSSSLFAWMEEAEVFFPAENNQPEEDEMAVILYTSGSSGNPKGVVLSQCALFNSGQLIANTFEWNESDIFMNLGDLHSMSGLRNTCLAPLHAGASFVIVSEIERNQVLFVFERIMEKKVTMLGIAPTVIRQMNTLFSDHRREMLKSLRAVLCTGGHLAQGQLQEFYSNYQIPVLNYYGLTETAGICCSHTLKSFSSSDSSIGQAVGAELFILPDENDNQENQTGELVVKSENLMSGYFKNDNETNLVLKNGCLYTGDIARKRKDGCYELLGRKRNIIKNILTELIHLEEIEQALEIHPFIREACACQYASIEEDEKIIALIVLNDMNDEINATISSIKKHMHHVVGKFRSPWCYYIENELPRNTSGKIQREKLKNRLDGYIQSGYKRYF